VSVPRNRSVPVDTVLPHVTYQNVAEAIAWLRTVFGFTEHYRYGAPDGAQMHLGGAWIMLKAARPDRVTPAHLDGRGTLTFAINPLDYPLFLPPLRSISAGSRIL